jgi:hypothetical protein
MGQLRTKLMARLRRRFPPPDKVILRDDDGITGVVTSAKFRGMDDIDRINLVWDAFNGDLSLDERREIAMIEAVTPEEEFVR